MLNEDNFNLKDIPDDVAEALAAGKRGADVFNNDKSNRNVYGNFGLKAQKIYFGNNPMSSSGEIYFYDKGVLRNKTGESFKGQQKWYIVGTEENEGKKYLVLLSDPEQPLLTNRKFAINYREHDWNSGDFESCRYIDEIASDMQVYPNHYSTSNLRADMMDMHGSTSSRFSNKEKAMMVTTRIYTQDGKNNKIYYNEDILYPAYSSNWENNEHKSLTTMTVGANTETGLDSGKEVNLYAISGYFFRLRAPIATTENNGIHAVVAYPGLGLVHDTVGSTMHCEVSASKIDISNVLFASLASPVSNSSGFDAQNSMTFRYKNEVGKINREAILLSNSAVKVTKSTGGADNVYLYIQGKNGTRDWVYSTKITDDTINDSTIVTNSQIGHDDADFSQCKIWIETFDENDNMVYAKFAKEDEVEAKEEPEPTPVPESDKGDKEPTSGDNQKPEPTSESEQDSEPIVASVEDNSASGSGFVSPSAPVLTNIEPMILKSLKESVEFGNKIVRTDFGATISVDASKIEDSTLTQEQKDMFKDKDAICLDLTSNGRFNKVETINYGLCKDLANQEFTVYYIYEGEIQLLAENCKVDNEGNIKITADHGATYILIMSK